MSSWCVCPASETDVFGLTVTYGYDHAGNETQLADSKGGVETMAYDSANRLTGEAFSDGTDQAAVTLGYDSRDMRTGVTRYSDAAETALAGTTGYGYDNAGRETAITDKNASAATIAYQNYQYDNADRVTQETWSSTTATGTLSGTHTYTYDAAGQLTGADGVSYAFDANGNRTTAGTLTYSSPVNNEVTNDGVYTYTYDAAGNLVTKSKGSGASLDLTTYTYDQRNLLTGVDETVGGTGVYTATYVYDVLGRRVEQQVWHTGGSTVTTRYAFDGDRVWAELDGSNNVQYRYLNGDGPTQTFARINVGGSSVAWLLADRLGSVRDVADTTQVNDHVEYTPYGGIASESSSASGVPLMFTGLNEDRTSGILEAKERDELVATGQWMQEDPIGFVAGDTNLRRYVGNNATNATDPTGLDEEKPKWNDQNAQGPGVRLALNGKGGKLEEQKKDLWSDTGKTPAGEKITVRLMKAYTGWWITNVDGGKGGTDEILDTSPGVYVKFSVELDPNPYDELRMIQVIQRVDKDSKPVQPGLGAEKHINNLRADWWNKKAISPGWCVDNHESNSSIWVTPGETTINYGKGKQPLELWDSPEAPANTGVNFYTAIFGIKKGKSTYLGTFQWGFKVDKDGNVSWNPAKPNLLDPAKPPQELGDSISKWKGFLKGSVRTGKFLYKEWDDYLDKVDGLKIDPNYGPNLDPPEPPPK
jgi:RHS repeat-associated protein